MTLDTIRAAIEADVPVLLWGAPGTGKTAAIYELARAAGAHTETLIGSMLDPVDVGGQPIPARGRVVIAPPAWAERLLAAIRAGRPAWLILDELSCAPPSVQAALLRVVHERRVAELDLTGCRVVAAANPADTAADGGSIAAATANRWAHVDWTVDASAWVAGEAAGWGTPSTGAIAAARAPVLGWITAQPAALLRVPQDPAAAGRAWPSPRSWSAAIRMLAATAVGAAARRAAVAATVGDAAAAEWATWVVAQDLPDAEAVLAGRARMPTRGDQARAVSIAVALAAAAEHAERTRRVGRAWEVLATLRPDVALVAARMLLESAPESIPDSAVALGDALLAVRAEVAR